MPFAPPNAWSSIPKALSSDAVGLTRLESYRDWCELNPGLAEELNKRTAYEGSLAERHGPQQQEFVVEGTCFPCASRASFKVDYSYAYAVEGRLMPNWREQLICPSCGLNNRMRASVHFVELLLVAPAIGRILMAERLTPLYRWMSRRSTNLEGFEFLDDAVPYGQRNIRGVRNETLTALTFQSDTFDCVLSFDVFEHIPHYRRAFEECSRVLRSGGVLLFSVPFRIDQTGNVVRARRTAGGAVEHLLPPNFHGDPINTQGCLTFHDFGWQVLEDVRSAGFSDVGAYLYWSNEFGYLGTNQILFLARK